MASIRAAFLVPLACLVGLVACAEGFSGPNGGSTGSGAAGGGGSGTGGQAGGSDGGQAGAVNQGGGGGSPPACAEDPCKLVAPQCGCDTGEKCTVNGSADIACGPDGSVAIGAACGASDCAAGGLCLGNANAGYCAQFCDQDSACAGNICAVQLNDGAGGTIPDVALCSSSCDPATAAGCPAGLGCVLGQEADGLLRFFFMCFGSGSTAEGGACNTAADCQVGFGCYNNGTIDACFRNCNVNAPSCTGIQSCYALNDANAQPVFVNGYAMGVCQ